MPSLIFVAERRLYFFETMSSPLSPQKAAGFTRDKGQSQRRGFGFQTVKSVQNGSSDDYNKTQKHIQGMRGKGQSSAAPPVKDSEVVRAVD